MEERDFIEDVNRVFLTAKSCLANLCNAQVEEALALNEVLKFKADGVGGNTSIASAIYQELRYRFLNNYIIESGVKNVLDLGCGYSPRGIYLASRGINYVGADLPAVIPDMRSAVKAVNFGDITGSIDYVEIDATNAASVIKAVLDIEGPICVISEGLMMYFPIYELDKVITSIKGVLSKNGGFFLTSDYESHNLLETTFKAVAGSFVTKVALFSADSIRDKYAGKSIDDDSLRWFNEESDEEAVEYFEDNGFTIEKIDVLPSKTMLHAFEFVEVEKEDEIREGLSAIKGWKASLKDDFKIEVSKNDNENLKIEAYRMDKEILFRLSGRLDTLSSPDLLRIFEAEKDMGSIRNVTLDIEDVEYISSAGLRVLLIMKKQTSKKSVLILNANAEVREIFETTGFDDVLDVSD